MVMCLALVLLSSGGAVGTGSSIWNCSFNDKPRSENESKRRSNNVSRA
jgi:hypothetical protein